MGNFSLSSGYITVLLNPEIIFEGVNPLCQILQSKSINMLLDIALLAPKLLTKSLRDFSQYPLRGEKQVTSKGWSISIT